MEFFRIHKTIPFMRYSLILNLISVVSFLVAVYWIFFHGLAFSIEFTGKEKLSAFQARRQKEGAGVGKRDVQNYLRKQQKEAKEPVNNAFAQALSGLKL